MAEPLTPADPGHHPPKTVDFPVEVAVRTLPLEPPGGRGGGQRNKPKRPQKHSREKPFEPEVRPSRTVLPSKMA